MTTYTATGDVRGNCGHKHRTPAAAARCADRDGRGGVAQGGYSDRYLVALEEGEERLPEEWEAEEWGETLHPLQ